MDAVPHVQTHQAFIALGSNLGDRAANIGSALARLDQSGDVTVTRVSKLLDNPAVGGPVDSPPFMNAVARVATDLEPDALMRRLLRIEQEMGRVREVKWEPRVIDLDLLLYGDRALSSDALTLPHLLMHRREFVLGPLNEIAPHAVHPTLQASVAELWERLRSGR